jgi:hypothetical protein
LLTGPFYLVIKKGAGAPFSIRQNEMPGSRLFQRFVAAKKILLIDLLIRNL